MYTVKLMYTYLSGTIVTSLPNTHKVSEPYNIKMLLSKEIEINKSRHAIQGPESLVDVILKTCLSIMSRKGPGGVKLQECFQSSINTIAESEAVTMKRLLKTVDKLANADNPFSLTAEIDSFSRISIESRQLVEIIDIQDELNIIKSVLQTQKEVLKDLQNRIRPQDNKGQATGGSGVDNRSVGQETDRDSPASTSGKGSQNRDRDGGNRERQSAVVTVLKSTRVIDESIRIVEDNIHRVKEMNESAKRVQAEVSTVPRQDVQPSTLSLTQWLNSSNSCLSSSSSKLAAGNPATQ